MSRARRALQKSALVLTPTGDKKMKRRTATIDAERGAAQTHDSDTPRSARRPLLDVRPASRKLRIGDHAVKLTPNELHFVQLLRRRGGRSVSRDVVCMTLWGRSGESYYGRLEILVKRLRNKLGVAQELIQTVRGSGYCLRARNASVSASHIVPND